MAARIEKEYPRLNMLELEFLSDGKLRFNKETNSVEILDSSIDHPLEFIKCLLDKVLIKINDIFYSKLKEQSIVKKYPESYTSTDKNNPNEFYGETLYQVWLTDRIVTYSELPIQKESTPEVPDLTPISE